MRRVATEIAVEREVDDPQGVRRRFRLTAQVASDNGAEAPSAAELARAYAELAQTLDGALPSGSVPAGAGRADRPIEELVEVYRPRQAELVELLLEDGEITPGESARMREFLASRPAPVASPDPGGIPPTDRPIAAAPLAQDRAPSVARPVDELIRLYRIESLRQAGAVRARRQISFEEYMALKRHFGPAESGPSANPS